jgi:CRP-like cAMP-binding protein
VYDLLLKHINKRIKISREELKPCANFITPKRIKKHQFLLQEGEVCRHVAFVNSGCLREYTVDSKGEEHILQFSIADWWISDLNSFLAETPATHNIDAVQDSEVLLFEKSMRERFLEAVPKMERFFRLLLEANYVATHKRIAESLSASAEERYLSFLQTYPALVEQVPQRDVASYLGITPQSLSRIRNELSHRK